MNYYLKSSLSPDYLVFIVNYIRETLCNAGFKIKKMDIQQPRVN